MRRLRNGQATLETVLALVAGLLFVVASMKVWLFFSQVLVKQQQCYNWSRRAAGRNSNPGLGLSNPLSGGGPPAYGNPFWGSVGADEMPRADKKPKLSIFGPNQFPTIQSSNACSS